MRLKRAIPAGIIDAGLASLATFALSLYAIRQWQASSPTILGIYFLYMSAFLMAANVPNQLLFVPAEKMTLDVPQRARVAMFGRIVRLGIPVAALSGLLVAFTIPVGASQGLSISSQVPFLISAAVAATFSPLQDHARRILHLAGRSWSAAIVSLSQVTAVAIGLAVASQMSIAAEWIPIGALAVANVASSGVAAMMIVRFTRALDPDSSGTAVDAARLLDHRSLGSSGRWLVGTGVMSTGNNFLAESLIVLIVGSPALALAGAAKTVAQPILVLASGLRSVLGPPSMEAAKARDRQAAHRSARIFAWLTALAVAGYSLIAGFAWIGNPLSRLVEEAYTVPFLVVLTIAANGLNGVAFPGRLELIGAGREKQMFFVELWANVTQLVVAVGAAFAAGGSTVAGSFARPVSFAGLGLLRVVGFEKALDKHYEPAAAATGSGLQR